MVVRWFFDDHSVELYNQIIVKYTTKPTKVKKRDRKVVCV